MHHSKIYESTTVVDLYILSPMQDMLPKSHEYVVMTSQSSNAPPPLPPRHVQGHISLHGEVADAHSKTCEREAHTRLKTSVSEQRTVGPKVKEIWPFTYA